MNRPKGKHKPKPLVEDFLSLFRNDPGSPRACLMSAVELRERFRSRGWDEAAAPALRDECEGTGTLEVYHGTRNQKLAGLPEMVQAFRKQQTEQNTILQQVPLASKSNGKKRKK